MKTSLSAMRTTSTLLCISALLSSIHCLADTPTTSGDAAWGIGLGVKAEQKPYRGVNNETSVLPMLSYENRWLRLAGPSLDLKIGQTGSIAYALTVSYGSDGYESSDSSYLSGMNKRKDGFWLGGRATWDTPLAALSTDWRADTSGYSNGQQASLTAEHRFSFGQLGVSPRLQAIWQDSQYVDYYYGVTAGEARTTRNVYHGNASTSGKIGVRMDYGLTESHMLFLDISSTLLGANIKDSPLVSRSTTTEAMFGYMYRF